jgi:hypothetical protein
MVILMTFDAAIPTVRVVCEGDSAEIGYAQGKALKQNIHATYEMLRDLEAFRLKQPWYLPFSLFRRIAAKRSHEAVRPAVEAACPSARQRLLGISRGSGLKESGLWLLNAMEGLLANVRENTDIPAPGGCSAVAIRGGMSQTGEPVIAHNFDYLPLVQPHYIIRESRPKQGYRSLEFTVAPLAGAVDGINEKGLAVTYNYAYTLDRADPGPTLSMLISEMLARFERVSDAIGWLEEQKRWGSGLLMFADREGDIASLEITNTRQAVRRPESGEDFLFHANKFRCKKTVAVEVPVEAVYNTRAPKALRGQRALDSSLQRMKRFVELLPGSERLSLEQLANVMADHGKDGHPTDKTICKHSDYWATTACIQLLPTKRVVRVSYSSACQARYVECSL